MSLFIYFKVKWLILKVVENFLYFSPHSILFFLIAKEEDETLAIFQSLIFSGKKFPQSKAISLFWIPVAFICVPMEL